MCTRMCVCVSAVAAAIGLTCSDSVNLAVKVIVAVTDPRQSNPPSHKSSLFGLSLTPIATCPQSLPKAAVGHQ